MVELELIKDSARRFSNALSSTQAQAAISTAAGNPDYFPYIPVGQLRNIAFDLYKEETDFLSKPATTALFKAYIDDDLFFACAADFRQEAFISLSKDRKIKAIQNAVEMANNLHDSADSCLHQLSTDRIIVNRHEKTRKRLKISVPDR